MAFHVRDPETDRVVRQLAALKGMTLTDVIRDAAAKELEAFVAAEAERDKGKTLEQVVKEIQDDLARFPKTGLKADKEFYDDLSGGL
ncbi:MAG: type II toxin-antitoxin system VapB family antitoxin [Beijerinckiaceae bacterium]